jgi:hypothetical protein
VLGREVEVQRRDRDAPAAIAAEVGARLVVEAGASP